MEYSDNSYYNLKLPTLLTSKKWAEDNSISRFYSFFSNRLNIDSVKKIEFDFSNCLWIDPFPLMSLIVFTVENVIPYFKINEIIYNFPELKGNFDEKTKSYKQNKLLFFLYSEGFIKIIDNIVNENKDKIKIKGFNYMSDFQNIFDQIGTKLDYFDCHLCGAQLIKTHTDNYFEKMSFLMPKIRANLLNRKLSSYIINDILYKIEVFLNETLDNVKKYAYDDINSNKYAMIYLRYRHGKRNTSINMMQKEKLNSLIQIEYRNHSKIFLQDIYEDSNGFIEIFVLDVGKGISETTGYRAKKNRTHESFRHVFKNKRDVPGKTLYGGLNFIGQILAKENIFSKDREVWLGAKLPIVTNNNFWEYILPEEKERYHTPGCLLLARITGNNNLELDENETYSNYWKNASYYNSEIIRNVYKSDYGSDILNSYSFIDERFEPLKEDWKKRKELYKNKLDEDKDNIIYFSPENTQKYLIFNKIILDFLDVLSSVKTLIFVDIRINEKQTYISALNGSRLETYYAQKAENFLSIIILITRDLSCSILEYNKNIRAYVYNSNLTDNFIKEDNLHPFSLTETLKRIVTYDSKKIWDNVKQLRKYNTFVNSSILWNDNEPVKYINGYLDFNQLCTIPKFPKIFEIGVLRFMGTFKEPNKIIIHSLDVLVKNIVNNLKSKLIYINEEKNRLFIGSVLVSGVVQNEAIEMNDSSEFIHCFIHPDSIQTNSKHLFIWPKREWIDKLSPNTNIKQYKRLGKTHAIAPDGWKFYKIPRYSLNNELLYFRSPKETYQDWQSARIGMHIGNYEYEGYLELFKLDIKTTIDMAFAYYSDLALYLFANFFIALGGRNKKQIDDPLMRDKSWGLIDSILSDPTKMSFYENIVLITYPNHYYASLVIGRLSNMLDNKFFSGNENQPSFIQKIVPLNFIRSSNSNSCGLISELSFCEIENVLNESKKEHKEILFFDDAIVNGRTRKEIKHLLLNLFSVNEVKTLSIIDRYRLPYDIPKPRTHKSFWRLDVPRLGNDKYNPISKALDMAKNKAVNFIPSAKNIINDWDKAWKKRNSFRDDSSHGLMPVTLNLKNPEKEFCIKFDKSINTSIREKIRIDNSIGAAIHTVETYCLTGRDDIAFDYANLDTEEVSESAKVQILCTFLLLFESELKPNIKILMIDKLIEIINNQPNKRDNETALACITLINSFINNKVTFSESTLEKAKIKFKTFNDDLCVAFAVVLPQEIIKENKFLNRIIIDNSSEKEWRDRESFHYELYENGVTHINVFRGYVSGDERYKSSPQQLIFSLESFVEKCNNFEPTLFSETNGKEKINILVNNAINLLKNSKKNETEIRNNIIEINNHFVSIHKNLFYQLSSIRNQTTDIVDLNVNNFFLTTMVYNISNQNENYWQSLAEEKNKTDKKEWTPKIYQTNRIRTILKQLNNDEKSLWIPYDYKVEKHIKNIISNVIYSSGKIKSPFHVDSLFEEADMWYDVELDNDEFIIKFANKIENENEIDKAKNSVRNEKYHSGKMGWKTEYMNIRNSENDIILICKLSVKIFK